LSTGDSTERIMADIDVIRKIVVQVFYPSLCMSQLDEKLAAIM